MELQYNKKYMKNRIISLLQKVIRGIDARLSKMSYTDFLEKVVAEDLRLLEKSGKEIKRLSDVQKKQVKALWGRGVDISLHELIYSATGIFKAEYCPLVYFRTKLEYALNDQRLAPAWSDKNYFDRFFPYAKFPDTIVRNINGTFLDKNYFPITLEEVLNIISSFDKVIIKPSIDSYCGAGLSMIKNTKADNLVDILSSYKKNYTIQNVLKQHESIARLNPSSVNVIRYNTLLLNGSVKPLSATLRCGAEGAINDNSITSDGRGMFMIGIEPNGCLKDTAYYACGEMLHKAPNGESFAGMSIPNFDKITQLVTKMHSEMPYFGFIGFDVAVNEGGDPVIMEYNIRVPGIMYYQYTNGPLFGSYTNEIVSLYK